MMLATPRPGVNRENLLKTLQSVHTDVYNLDSAGVHHGWVTSYDFRRDFSIYIARWGAAGVAVRGGSGFRLRRAGRVPGGYSFRW